MISCVWKILQTFGYQNGAARQFMAKLCCVDYGFECEYAAESENVSDMIEKFAKHTSEEHGIEYSKEALMQFMLRKHNSTKYEDVYMQAA